MSSAGLNNQPHSHVFTVAMINYNRLKIDAQVLSVADASEIRESYRIFEPATYSAYTGVVLLIFYSMSPQ